MQSVMSTFGRTLEAAAAALRRQEALAPGPGGPGRRRRAAARAFGTPASSNRLRPVALETDDAEITGLLCRYDAGTYSRLERRTLQRRRMRTAVPRISGRHLRPSGRQSEVGHFQTSGHAWR
jgi:hypothetical protein